MRTRSFAPRPSISSPAPAPPAVIQTRPFQAEPAAGRGVLPSRGFGVEALRPAGSGRTLPEGMRTGMEAAFGADFSRVRVHEGDAPPRIGAEAFTRGEHIHFARGRFRPGSAAGRGVLGHELAHVLQQRARRVTAPRGAGLPVNADRALEAEAESAGARAALGRSVVLRGIAPAGRTPAPAPPRAHSAAPAQAAPVQCLRTAGGFASAMQQSGAEIDHEHLAGMRDALERFHADRGEKDDQEYVDHRAKALYDAEHHAYRYFDAIKGQGAAGGQRGHMLNMLDEIQDAHIEHTDTVHRGNLRLWTPDRGTLGVGGRQQLDADWDQLRGHTPGGMVQLPGDEQGAKEIRSMQARLLARPHGRALLHELNTSAGHDDQRTITHEIHDRSTLNQDPEVRRKKLNFERVLKPRHEQLQRQYNARLEELRDIHGPLDSRVLEKDDEELGRLGEESDEAYWQVTQHLGRMDAQAGVLSPEEPAIASEQDNRKGPGNRGRGSTVHLVRGLRDSENLTKDAAGNMVPAPAFITYGHELVHALHSRNETGDVTTDSARYEHGHDLAHWSNREEHITIDESRHGEVTENMLRGEHDITGRHGHGAQTRDEVERPEREARTRRNWMIGGGILLGGLALLGGGLALAKYLKK